MTEYEMDIEEISSKTMTIEGKPKGKLIDLRLVRELCEEKGYDIEDVINKIFNQDK